MTEEFNQRLVINSRHVLVYENPALQAKAKASVPLNELLSKAKNQCHSTDSQVLRDALLIELLNWFKNEFFSWFDAAHCQVCNVSMQNRGNGVPTSEDVRYGANRVESYLCGTCGATDRFPRYNDPGNLFILHLK